MIAPETFDLIAVLDCLIKGFLVLLIAFSADLMLRRSAATVRHLVWVLAMAAVLLCPFATLLVPQVDLPLFAIGAGGLEGAMDLEGPTTEADGASGVSGTQVLLYGYLLGVVLVLIWQLIGRLYANRLRGLAKSVNDPELLAVFRRVKAQLETDGRVDLVMSEIVTIPFSTGFFRPAVVLPATAGEWPSEILRTVLVHELGHVKRKDVITRALAQLSCSLHWVNPIAWYGLRRVLIEQEIACDDLVLETGTKPSVYARALLVLARAGGGKLSFATTALGRRAELKDRLLEILKPRRSKAPLGTAGVLAGLCAALLFLGPLSALNFWEPEEGPAVPANEKEVVESEQKAQQSQGKLIKDLEKAKKEKPSKTKEVPDLKREVALIKKKTRAMKENGASEKDIEVFITEAKKKLAELEKEFKEAQSVSETKKKAKAKQVVEQKGKVREG